MYGRQKSMTSDRGIAEGAVMEEGKVDGRQKRMTSEHDNHKERKCNG